MWVPVRLLKYVDAGHFNNSKVFLIFAEYVNVGLWIM